MPEVERKPLNVLHLKDEREKGRKNTLTESLESMYESGW